MLVSLDQLALAVVDHVLDELGGPAGEGLDAGLEFFVLPLDLDGLVALGLSGAGEGETALLGLIRPGLFEDDRVEHDEIAVLALDGDDALCSADHVRRHADTAVFVGDERFQQVLRDGQVFRQGRRGFSGEKKLVFADVTNHIISASQEFRRRSHRWRGAFSAHPRLRPSWMPRRLSGRQRPVWLPAWLLLCRAS